MYGEGFAQRIDKSQSYIVEMTTRFAKRGYVCISINYRVCENPKDEKVRIMNDAFARFLSDIISEI